MRLDSCGDLPTNDPINLARISSKKHFVVLTKGTKRSKQITPLIDVTTEALDKNDQPL